MKQIYDNLWQSERYSMGGVNTHAYLLTREKDNVLFYNSGNAQDLDRIEELGGISYQLLTHRDEVGKSLARIKERFHSQLGSSAKEERFAATVTDVDIVFSDSDTSLDDIQIIHTPGHTDGSVCFYYASPNGKSYLFTGDTLFQSQGKWSTFVLTNSGGSKESLINSLEKLRLFNPNVVLSSAFVGDIAYREMNQQEWNATLDQTILSLTDK